MRPDDDVTAQPPDRLRTDSRALVDLFTDRLTEQQLSRLTELGDAGEWAELVDRLCASLVRRRIPVTPAEREAVAGVLAQFTRPLPHHEFLCDPAATLAALGTAALDTGKPTIRIARLFDGKDAHGDWTFDPGRPRITDPVELARIVGFLRSGAIIVRISGLDRDRLDRRRGQAVPLSTMTDGEWIWSDGLRYYVETHGIAPEPDFLAHIAAHGYVTPRPDEAARRAALERLRAPDR